jgi:type IV pilus assembly protein PilE
MTNHDAYAGNMTPAGAVRREARGFTLLELMIVVIVIAVLAVLAVSSYQFANVKARRSAAKGCLTQSAQYMERYYTTKLSYTDSTGKDMPKGPKDICDSEVQKFYDVDFDGAATATTYKLKAVPTASQKDGKCGTLTLDQAGTKTPDKDGCW